MKLDKLDKKTLKILSIAMLVALLFGAYFIRDYFVLIAFAAILAFLFNPVYKWLLKKTNGKKGLSSGLTFLAVIFTITIPLAIVVAITVEQALQLSTMIKEASTNSSGIYNTIVNLIDGVNRQLDNIPNVGPDTIQIAQITEWLKTNASEFLKSAVSYLSGIAGGLGSLVTKSIIFIYVFLAFLKKQDSILALIRNLNPLGDKVTDHYLAKMGAMTSAMVKGQFAIAVVQGLTDALLLKIVGFDFFIFWFVLLTFLSIIPLGGGIIVLPIGVIMLLTGHVWEGLVLILGHILIVTNEDNFLRPRFVPNSARLDSALLLISVFAGIAMFGFLGIVIGPVIMIVIVTTIDVYVNTIKKSSATDVSSVNKSVKS
ncbi:AI-2E family transporter [Candidatus Saccharibacteria bacterium]|nr:AI-2E family transporter [Candidatus Saccharibacteria bacterium]MBP7834572.1 AI-2E family transporter [Candidatus Saccharibacteria bacterium]